MKILGKKVKPLEFKTSQEWRLWLSKNHSLAKEAYLIHYKTSSKRKGLRYKEALEEALCFGWIDHILKSLDKNRYILRYSPRKTNSIWSLKNKNKALELIKQGRMTKAGLEKIKEAKANGRWAKAYTSQKTEEVPPDLKKELQKSKELYNKFSKLSPSHRNQYIFWLNDARKADTRERRIKQIISFITKL